MSRSFDMVRSPGRRLPQPTVVGSSPLPLPATGAVPQASISRRRALLGTAAVLGASTGLAGCAGPAITDYAAERPLLDLRSYFNGDIAAHGIFIDRSGKVVRRFTVAMACSWAGNEGVLDERFVYSDGKQERRVWRLTYLGDGRYTGRADDVVGIATGQTSGNSFRWNYTLALPVDGRVWEVQFDDWMHLVDDRIMLNRATMSKFGIRLGEVLLTFTRPAGAKQPTGAAQPGGAQAQTNPIPPPPPRRD